MLPAGAHAALTFSLFLLVLALSWRLAESPQRLAQGGVRSQEDRAQAQVRPHVCKRCAWEGGGELRLCTGDTR